MKIFITNQAGSYDVTKLITSAHWSGGRGQCSRVLQFGLLHSELMGVVDCSLGAAVTMVENGQTLFSGYIFERSKSTVDSVIDITCFDRGIYLKRNEISRSFSQITPEAATASIAAEFNIAVGKIAAAGIPISRNFLGGCSLYDIISTLYTLASKQNGKAYLPVFAADKLEVREIGAAGSALYIEAGHNLIDASTTESTRNLVNRIAVLDKNGSTLYTKSDDNSIKLYGLMQQMLKQQDNADVSSEVEQMLKLAVPQQRITVNCLGNVSCVTGGMVMMHEPYTNLYGKFYIESDAHQWKNGIYTNKLTLTLEAVMDQKSAGTALLGESGSSTQYAQALENLQNAAGKG